MNSEKFSHVILTRFNTKEDNEGKLLYDKEGADEWMDHRMPLFAETKKSVLNQNRSNFTWVISVDERTPKKYLKEIKGPGIKIVNCNVLDVFADYKLDTPWVITTRLDCDDILMPGALEMVQQAFEPKLKVIDFNSFQLDYATKKLYGGTIGKVQSMFLSLIEPSDRVLTAFCRPHTNLAEGYPLGGNREEGYRQLTRISSEHIERRGAIMVCHDRNAGNRVSGMYVSRLGDIYSKRLVLQGWMP